MLRALFFIFLFASPLLAVAPDAAGLALDAAAIEIRLGTDTARVSYTLSARNAGEAAEFKLRLPLEQVPPAQRESLKLRVDSTESAGTKTEDHVEWPVSIDAGTTRVLAWSTELGLTNLPHIHALGRRELRLKLAYLRAWDALPADIPVTVEHPGLPDTLFDHAGPTLQVRHPGGARVADFHFSWLASTPEARLAQLNQTLDAIAEAQRTASNRAWTETLAHIVDVARLVNDHALIAKHCETLARLEGAGNAITGCGPWAKWRAYVPWVLLRMQALEAQGQDTAACAREANLVMAARWPAYLKARKDSRPFDEFDRGRFGAYWDYDWTVTRDLYARALRISGDATAAEAVSGTG